MSSRSTPRRRKVVSTSHALDLLNNLNANNNNNVTRQPKSSARTRARARSSRRRKIDDVPFPQSDDIWEVPDDTNHDRSEHVPAPEPLTPRRSSTRLLAKSGGKTTSLRKATRRAKVKSGPEPQQEFGGGSENHPDKEAEEYTNPVEEDHGSGESDANYVDVVEDHGDNGFPQPVLDSPHNVPQSNRLSPFDIPKRVSDLGLALHGRTDESGDRSPEQPDEPRSGSDDAVSAHEHQRSSPAVAIVNPATDVRSSVGRAESSARSPESSRENTLPEDTSQHSHVQGESGGLADGVELDEAEDGGDREDHTSIAVGDKSSVHGPTDDEGSVRDRPIRPGLFRYESDPEDLSTPPSKRRQTSNQQPVSERQGRIRRRSIETSRAVTSNNHEDQTEPLQPRHSPNDTEQYAEDMSDDYSEDDFDEEEAWLHQALKMAGQKNNWDALVVQAHHVQKTDNPSMAEYFDDFGDLTSTLQQKYMEIVGYLNAGRGPRHATVRECDELLNAIRSDGTTSVDYIVEHKDDEPEIGRPSSEETLDEFEACLVSGMMGVLLACFEAYCKEDGLFPKAYEHLHRVLDVFLRLCYKIYCVVDAGYVDSENRSHSLQLPLKKLIIALEKDLFKGSAPQPEPVPAMSIKHGRRWTDDEGCALLDGLQRYQGRDRYARILKHFGDRLRGRTIRGTREKARQLHDKLLSTVVNPEVLQTEEGRQQWYWLLSVRED
ncbi:hypothetical protein BDV37DRAFT_246129 [Aspergillus pseudonomiae]|uniref:Uncharacterized protein n=1 Tax=Aspergillus pseudonomiae TaxID=1506151 RepID=A0A5N7DGR8_9EURO|nr:uncharacterized protein BDV37DRAFT_246129 [Aspergillus pseudonomiae]KAE8405233.1 hypothetical protein BDV37DRAFT_246129 [Aspergillus pseudonomiae]